MWPNGNIQCFGFMRHRFWKEVPYRNPTLRDVWGRHSHSRKWEFGIPRTPENSEEDYRRQNTFHWGVPYIIGKVLKYRWPKWPRIGDLNICSPSYVQKKGRKSNWQFDSRPLKVGNRPAPDVRWESAIRRWKALDESYNIGSDLVPIGGQGEKLWPSKVPGVQTGTVSGLHFGSPGTKSHSDVASVE
jgi:hypothetical protein